jgi:alkylation response protein AidB-like acyl-CoA dehydrogenase
MGGTTREELVERARKLAPALAERAEACERLRRLPDATIEDFRREGLLRAFVAPRYGGYGLELSTVIETAREVGRFCGSSAWCLAICTLHNHIVSAFPEPAQDWVFGRGPDRVVCGVFVPGGTAVADGSGYLLSGRWDFASTCDHADFAVLAAFVAPAPAAAPTGMASFLVERAQFGIEDNWHVSGLAGTGSKRVVVDAVAVPPERALPTDLDAAITGDRETTARGRASAGLPGTSVATLGLTGVAIGIAYGAIDRFRERLAGKLRVATRKTVEQQVGAQLRLAEAAAEVDAAELLVLRDCAEMTADARAGRTATLEQRARYRRDAAWSVQTCARAVQRLAPAAGAHAIFLDQPIQRAARDIAAFAAHVVADWDASGESYARALLGLPKIDPLV